MALFITLAAIVGTGLIMITGIFLAIAFTRSEEKRNKRAMST